MHRTHRILFSSPLGFVTASLVLVVGLSFIVGCDKSSKEGVPLTAPEPGAMPPNHPPIGGHAKNGGEVLEGTLAETMEAGGYTYLHMDTSKGKIWAAVPRAQVTVGEKLTIEEAMPMTNFESPSLGRKFEKIYFGVLRGAKASPHGSSGAAPMASALPIPSEIKVEKAVGTNAHTVAELFAKAKDLTGQEVRVRGVVIKVNKRIMGRNWIHLQDGTGSEASKDKDLVVTSEEMPRVGATVLMTGKLASDKDFGSGYAYTVLVEEASFTVEGGE